MHKYDYKTKPKFSLTPEIVSMLTLIHEHKGKQNLYVEAHADTLSSFLEIARIQSTGASNRIEGIYTTDKRLRELVRGNSTPRNRNEQEIAGYREILSTIHESYDYIRICPNIILQLHKQLYSFAGSLGGFWKSTNNVIAETDETGNETVRFRPVPSHLTPMAIEESCSAFNKATEKNEIDRLILIPMFILDFLCIHPFDDGNGRISRLLTLLLLYHAGYIVGKYISLEKIIEDTKETYYESLQASSCLWHENKNDYLPFIRYCLGILIKAYSEFESRVEYLRIKKLSKPERIKDFISGKTGKVTKKEILEIFPDISKITVERTLAGLVKEGFLVMVGAGPTAGYVKKWDFG
jgi:Fic family protein